jgi:hypothetical protein
MPIETYTNEYERSHGRKPRGAGSWAFTFRRGGKWTSEPTFIHGRTFGEAKRDAMRKARELQADAISVQP